MQQNPNFENADDDELAVVREFDADVEENVHTRDYRFNDLLVTKNIPTNKPVLDDEIRTYVDTVKFAESSSIVLASTHSHLKPILREILTKICTKVLEENDGKNKYGLSLEQMIESAMGALIINNSDEEGSCFQFSQTVQGFQHNDETGDMETDPTWLVCMGSLPWLSDRQFGLVSLKHAVNLGGCHNGVRIMAIVLVPSHSTKAVKSDLETSRHIGALLTNINFRSVIIEDDYAPTDNQYSLNNNHVCQNHEEHIRKYALEIIGGMKGSSKCSLKINVGNVDEEDNDKIEENPVLFGQGIYHDFRRRINDYKSDFTESFTDFKSFIKVLSTIFFLFFANLLPTIAFGMLNELQTGGNINITKGLFAQLIGGLGYALFGGQHLTILLTTAPLSIFMLVIYQIGAQMSFDFFQFYAWIGIFNSIYLVLYAFFGLSKIMKYSTRSTEETFGLFISIAFIVDSAKACYKSFSDYYLGGKCAAGLATECLKEESLLFLILLLGTVILALWLNGFTDTPYLNQICRRLIADFALPVSVILMSFVGRFLFQDVKMHSFKTASLFSANATKSLQSFQTFVPLLNLPPTGILIAAGLALPMSILFFMDQNISSSMVNSPANSLRKKAAYHWDLVVISGLNLVLSLLGLPWVHGAIPHSPMHVTALAFTEEHVDQSNHVTQRVIRVVETRIGSAVANILVGCCLFLMPIPLDYIPSPVLYGLFLFMALSALKHNQFFERLLLFFTQQSAYPPNHYLRRVPQKKVHIFTLLQVLQLLVLCALGFFNEPYVKMAFPLMLIIQLPIRHVLLPKIVRKRYLDALDRAI